MPVFTAMSGRAGRLGTMGLSRGWNRAWVACSGVRNPAPNPATSGDKYGVHGTRTRKSNSGRELIQVTRWGRPGLRSGDWVMKGGKTRLYYVLSFKWQRGPGNRYASFASGETFLVRRSALAAPRWARGGLDGPWKVLFRQHQYLP